jgi:hypothetical protein
MRYRYTDVPFKPYVEQLFSPGGVNILLDAPPDHLHHHGLMFAIKVDGVTFWVEKKDSGRQVHRSLSGFDETGQCAMRNGDFSQHIDWVGPDKKESLVSETRTITVWPTKETGPTVLSWQSEFKVPTGKGKVTLTGDCYHGLGMRFRVPTEGRGWFVNADAKVGEVVRGDEQLVTSAWCAYVADVNGQSITVAMFDHPENPRQAMWFTMTKPFSYLSATMNLHREPLTLLTGKEMTLSYAVAVWDGHVETSRIERLYRQWVSSPRPKP